MNGGVLIMKKYLKEILILLIQLFMFYVFPLFAGPTDVMGMIVLLILATLLLSILIGSISNLKVKYLYPIIIIGILSKNTVTPVGIPVIY